MSEQIDINLNDLGGSGGDQAGPNPLGATAQDKNFDSLTGGSDTFRPESFPAMPELLNLMSIMADTSTTIRKVFLPLRKLFQIMARKDQGEAPSAQLANRNQDFTPKKAKTEEESLIDKIKGQVAGMGYPVNNGPTKKSAPNKKGSVVKPDFGKDSTQLLKDVFGKRFGGGISKMMGNASGILSNKFSKIGGQIGTKFGPIMQSASTLLTNNFTAISTVATGVAAGFAVFAAAIGAAALAVMAYNAVLNNFINRTRDVSPEIQTAEARAEVEQIRLSQELNKKAGQPAANIIEAKAEFGRELQTIGASIITTFEPLISGGLKLLTGLVKISSALWEIFGPLIQFIMEVLGTLMEGLGVIFGGIAYVAELLVGSAEDASKYHEFIMNSGLGSNAPGLHDALRVFGVTKYDWNKFIKNRSPDAAIPKVNL